MNKKKIGIVLGILLVFLLIFFLNPKEKTKEENILYSKQFENVIYRFKQEDYALGQNWIISIEKSTDFGKTFTKMNEEGLTVSQKPLFSILDPTLIFAIKSENLQKYNDYLGIYVSHDEGKTFQNAKILYDKDSIEILTIEKPPYKQNQDLLLLCSIYTLNDQRDGYQTKELLFQSTDQGLTWTLKDRVEENK